MFKWSAFLTIWAGQVVSLLGSSLSGFALGIWLYQTTGSASNFALTALCSVLPQLLISPLAGGLADRYPRRWMMIVGDSGSAVFTLGLAVLGRVLGLRQAAVKGATLLAYLLAGGMADRVLEPLLLPGGALAGGLGVWIGVGPGRGIAALCVLIGLLKAAAAIAVAASTAGSQEV